MHGKTRREQALSLLQATYQFLFSINVIKALEIPTYVGTAWDAMIGLLKVMLWFVWII